MVVGVFVYVYYMLLNLVSKVGVSLIENCWKCKSYFVYAFVELLLSLLSSWGGCHKC